MESDVFRELTRNKHACQFKVKEDESIEDLHVGLWKKRILRFTVIQEKYAQNSETFRSLASILSERRRHISKKYFVIHPFSTVGFYWDLWMCILYHIAFTFIPLEACNVYYAQLRPDLFINFGIPMVLMHFFFIIDIILRFNIGYVTKQGRQIVLNRNLIMQYMRTAFFIDIISTGPAILNAIRLYFLPGRKYYYIVTILNLLKLFKLRSLTTCGNRFSYFFHYQGLKHQIFRFVLRSVFFMHWAACIIFVLPFILSPRPITVFSANSWIHLIRSNVAKMNVFKMYLASLFAAISILLRCSATRAPEGVIDFITAVIFAILGNVYKCYLFIQILHMTRSVLESSTKYDEFITQLHDYMKYNHLPPVIQQRMYMLYEHRYQKTYYREEYILKTLPERMVKEMDATNCRRMMSQIEIFKTLKIELLNDIIDHLVLKIYLPRDIVSRARVINRYVYFISYGTVAAYTLSGEEICHMYDGSYFGEIAIWKKDNKNIYNVIAIEICEIYALERDIFTKAISSDPVILQKVVELAKQRMKDTRAVEAISKSNIRSTTINLTPSIQIE